MFNVALKQKSCIPIPKFYKSANTSLMLQGSKFINCRRNNIGCEAYVSETLLNGVIQKEPQLFMWLC